MLMDTCTSTVTPGDKMIFTLLILLHVCILTVDSKISPHSEGSGVIQQNVFPLDNAPESVDDMYYGCTPKMHEKVNNYLRSELKNEIFKNIWTKSEKWAEDKLKCNCNKLDLKLDHFKALYCYTYNKNHFYHNFMTAVRTKGPVYKSGFSYHAIHFLLSDAIRLLKKRQPECVTTYRRTKDTFNVKDDTEIRFGSFTSSSLKSNLVKYGEQDCFEIMTCYGANLTCNEVTVDQEEVLIPPYEKFKIMPIEDPKKVLNCKKLYKLTSSGIESNLNCLAVRTANSGGQNLNLKAADVNAIVQPNAF
ncbi:erythroblast NAD(P)(+)--arginine ADP-ribosyltransferase-like [Osmerus eperlanus]|uniref:erythroblast NAD(P)(+)--arginine ADP-ribosyltransferase-like n=1 Tax=Osmerus eperlanus TaxID=29151 RepID=UPI002E15D138